MVWRLRYAVIVAGISIGYEFITLRRPRPWGLSDTALRYCTAAIPLCRQSQTAGGHRQYTAGARCPDLYVHLIYFDPAAGYSCTLVYTQVRVTLILIQYAPPPLLHRLPFKGNMCKLSTCSVDITFNTNTVKSVKRAPARLTSGTVWAYICTTSDTCMVIRERAIHAESGCSVDVLKYSCSVDIFYRSGGACGSSCGGHSGGSGIMCNPSTAAVIYSRQTSNRVSTEQVLG